jgi:hypothetical protein
LLYAAEYMLNCETVACVAPESAIAEFLTQLRRHAERTEICFEKIREPREMAWITCNYADELRAQRVAVASASSHIWVRFYCGRSVRDLLFCVSGAGAPVYSLNRVVEKGKARSGPPADHGKDGVANATGSV